MCSNTIDTNPVNRVRDVNRPIVEMNGYTNAPGFPGGTRNTSPIWTQEINNGNTDLIVQFHDHSEFRGAVNALIRLIDVHGIDKLRRVGIVGQGSGMNSSSIGVCQFG